MLLPRHVNGNRTATFDRVTTPSTLSSDPD